MERGKARQKWTKGTIGGIACLTALLLTLLLPLSGCGQEETTGQQEDTPWYQEEQTEQEEPSAALPERMALSYREGQSLDPITCVEGMQLQVANLLYEPLFALDSTFTREEVLCDGYTVSEDGLRYELHIRSGVRFWDGSELAASDVAATLRRALTSERYGNRLSDIRRITVNGTDTVCLELYQANGALPDLLDIPIVKSGTEEDTVPVGTGPYLYITDDNGAYLSANGDWWRGTEQPISQIALVDAKDTETEQYLFNSYEIHVYTADLTSGTAALTGSLSWVDAPTAVMQFVGVNVSRPLLSDAAVRRALSVGIDRATVVTGYLSGHAEAASFPVSPRSTLYPEELEESYSATAYSTALEQAGLRAGEQQTLRLLVNADSEEKVSIANYMAQTWSHYDLQVIVEALPWEEYLAALAAGNFDLYYGEVKLRSDWDVPELIGTNGALNYGGYTAEETDALLAAFRTSGSRQPAAEALYAHLTQSCPILPVCFKNISVLTHRGMIEGMAPTAANIFYRMEDWQIAVAETAE